MAVLPPPTGDNPLAGDPSTFQWGQGDFQGPGGGLQAGKYYAWLDFSKLFGRNPTQAELDQLAPSYMGGDPNRANVGGGDQAVSSYYNQQQQVANAPQQEKKQLEAQIPLISNLVKNQTSAISSDLLNPNSPTYQQFSTMMNNMGITPSSGAFQAGLGGTIGSSAAQAENAALGSVGLPIAQTYAQGATTPFTSAMNQPGQLFQNNLQMQNLLQEIAAMPKNNQGSGIIGDTIGGGLSGAIAGGAKGGLPGAAAGGAIGAGGGYAKGSGTYICTELCNLGLLSRAEVAAIHTHLFRAKWKMPLKFLGYFIFGKLLVLLANKANTTWSLWKPEFYDRVMEESDQVQAVRVYESAFWSLFHMVKYRLRVKSMNNFLPGGTDGL